VTDLPADIEHLTAIGRQVAAGDRALDLASAVELVLILDAIDQAVDKREKQ
jgi:hypothetical protein